MRLRGYPADILNAVHGKKQVVYGSTVRKKMVHRNIHFNNIISIIVKNFCQQSERLF